VVTIRAVGAGDAEPLRALRLRALRLRALADAPDAFGAAIEDEMAEPTAHWAQLARRSEEADTIVIYVVVDGDRWVGMAAGRWYERERGIAGLWSMWVEPAMRGRRLGERLVAEVQAWAAARGGRFLRLGVVTAADDPTPFYERLGFVRTGELGTLRRDPSRGFHYLVRPI
jgi:GNAT superfamily N-acetyltransferase